MLGDDPVAPAIESRTALTEGFPDVITHYAWGGVWTCEEGARDELTRAASRVSYPQARIDHRLSRNGDSERRRRNGDHPGFWPI